MTISRFAAPAGLIAMSALTLTPQVLAQGNSSKPPPPPAPAAVTVSIAAKPNPIVFSGLTTVSGRVSNPKKAGVTVRLEQDTTAPYGDAYKLTTLTATTNPNGDYSFAAKPLVNTSFRAVAQTSPNVRSGGSFVRVRTLVGVRLSDSTPRRGSLVRFYGSVFPAHDGARALIQRRTSSGGFVTVARPLLVDAGTARSTYARRIRIFRDGVYRVKVAKDGDHANGYSKTRTVTVG